MSEDWPHGLEPMVQSLTSQGGVSSSCIRLEPPRWSVLLPLLESPASHVVSLQTSGNIVIPQNSHSHFFGFRLSLTTRDSLENIFFIFALRFHLVSSNVKLRKVRRIEFAGNFRTEDKWYMCMCVHACMCVYVCACVCVCVF